MKESDTPVAPSIKLLASCDDLPFRPTAARMIRVRMNSPRAMNATVAILSAMRLPARSHFGCGSCSMRTIEWTSTATALSSTTTSMRNGSESAPYSCQYIKANVATKAAIPAIITKARFLLAMCVRFRLTAGHGERVRRFEFNGDWDAWDAFDARNNIAPTQSILTVVGGEDRRAGFMRWELLPHRARTPRSARA